MMKSGHSVRLRYGNLFPSGWKSFFNRTQMANKHICQWKSHQLRPFDPNIHPSRDNTLHNSEPTCSSRGLHYFSTSQLECPFLLYCLLLKPKAFLGGLQSPGWITWSLWTCWSLPFLTRIMWMICSHLMCFLEISRVKGTNLQILRPMLFFLPIKVILFFFLESTSVCHICWHPWETSKNIKGNSTFCLVHVFIGFPRIKKKKRNILKNRFCFGIYFTVNVKVTNYNLTDRKQSFLFPTK